MTSDAKVGLLLGLLFIFLIAFLINGLPNLRGSENNNELTMSAVNTTNNNLGIADNERKASRQFIKQEIRFKTPLPKTRPLAENKPIFIAKPAKETFAKPVNNALKESLRKTAEKTAVTTKAESVSKIQANKPVLPKAYVVCAGDNLAVIARKFYGADEGNRKTNIMKIFKANSAILNSLDEIYVGQRLIIPPLSVSNSNYSRNDRSESAVFNKLKAIGKTVLAANTKRKSSGTYVVKTGDSLWTIAEERLGDGERYSDIFLMNTNILHDEDALVIGMRLKIPAQ